ncbi:glycosyltransferase [Gramella sp. AN32]|uniref:Glycosyltransferase n=1 Tax=Christiangramia antarctica TaxID=2058158 RepID=A0ABW5X0W0_9FLAO|nr:glycosyltransferase [Gramella sp. AN32]MCM4157109.1 glycosyl transferase family 1 [Gramella sp. AN32]
MTYKKIKVLHIIKSLGRGGAEMLLPETLYLHNSNQFEFHYIYFLPWKNQMVSALESHGGIVKCFPANNNLRIFTQTKNVMNYIETERINIIHCHLPWSGFLGRLIHKRTGIPSIYTEHNIQEKYHFLTKTLNRLTFNYQSLALGVSSDVTRSIRENIKPKIKVKTILNGVNTNKFIFESKSRLKIRNIYGIPESGAVIGNVAVFRKQKGLLDWIEAFKIVEKNNPNVYGLLIGAGPEEDVIKEKIERSNLENKIFLTGLQEDTVSFFSAMDIYMMSSHFEGLPIALLEAMSCGCAIISTKAGGVVEVITDNEDGYLCDVGDSECLAEKASNILNTSEKLELAKVKSREKVLKHFSLDRLVESLENIYLELYDNKRG